MHACQWADAGGQPVELATRLIVEEAPDLSRDATLQTVRKKSDLTSVDSHIAQWTSGGYRCNRALIVRPLAIDDHCGSDNRNKLSGGAGTLLCIRNQRVMGSRTSMINAASFEIAISRHRRTVHPLPRAML